MQKETEKIIDYFF